MPFRKLIPAPILSLYHFSWALAAAVWYGFPSRRLTVIGITGTKGKTTVTEILAHILKTADAEVALANGLHFTIGERQEPNMLKMTMPGRGRLQKFLRDAVRAGSRYAIIEVTSEGIMQHRHRFITFDVAALTNLQKDHIEAHGSLEAYRAAKGELFRACRNIHVINADDPNADYFKQFPARKKIFYSAADAARLGLALRIPGAFNMMNAVCAAVIAEALGIPHEIIRQRIAAFEGVPGRMQFVQKEPFAVVVDYAHTPDSLEAVYRAMRDEWSPKRLLCVLGAAGGGRDKWKRPVMGAIAARYCDAITLTDEDPYDEDPNQIVAEIRSGIPHDKIPMTKTILDRKEAISQTLRQAQPGDAVIITGKGAERWMMLARGKKIPWSDEEIARTALRELHQDSQ